MTNNREPNADNLYRLLTDGLQLAAPVFCPDFGDYSGHVNRKWNYGLNLAILKAGKLAARNNEQMAIIFFHKGLLLFNENNYGHASKAFDRSYDYAGYALNYLLMCLTLFAKGLVEHYGMDHEGAARIYDEVEECMKKQKEKNNKKSTSQEIKAMAFLDEMQKTLQKARSLYNKETKRGKDETVKIETRQV